MTFEQMRRQMEQAMEKLEQMQQSGSVGALPVSEEDCQWSDPRLDSMDTGGKRFPGIESK